MEWIEEPVDRQVKMGTVDEVRFTAKLSAKGKKAKWYMRNQVSSLPKQSKISVYLFQSTDTFITKIFVLENHTLIFFSLNLPLQWMKLEMKLVMKFWRHLKLL